MSWGADNLHPLTLSEYLGTLTEGWVVPLADTELTLVPGFQLSTQIKRSELNKGAKGFPPVTPNLYSTA